MAAVAGYVWIYAGGLQTTPVRSDGFGYFVYLPAVIVHHDPTLETTARECCGGAFPAWTAIIRWPGTSRYVSAHPIGVSILLLPAYVAAHPDTLVEDPGRQSDSLRDRWHDNQRLDTTSWS